MPIHKKCGTEYYGKECPVCKRAHAAEYRAANKAKIKAHDAAYYAANADRIKANAAKWAQANPEKRRAISTNWAAQNKDKVKETQARHYEQNKSVIAARNKKWAEENKEKVYATTLIWRKQNRDKVNAITKRWMSKNQDRIRVYWQNKRVKRKLHIGDERLSPGIAKKLYMLQRGKCACCGEPLGSDYHLDHIMPLALGGTNTDDNIQLLRSTCNQQKHAKHPIDFMRQRGFLL